MAVHLENLRNALASLDEALDVARSADADPDATPRLLRVLHAGVIQNFEISYELCWKALQRVLVDELTSAVALGIPRKELFRQAARRGLIAEIQHWFDYHEARNMTAHTYHQDVAKASTHEPRCSRSTPGPC